MDRLDPSVVRTDRLNRLGHTVLGFSHTDSRLTQFRTMIGIFFGAVVVVLPLDLTIQARLYVASVAALYVPLSGFLIYRRFGGHSADFANSLSDILVTGACCLLIPDAFAVAAVAITAIVVVAIPVQRRSLLAVLAVVGVGVAGSLAFLDGAADWFVIPLVMSLLFPAFDLYFRDRRKMWEVSAERYQALIQASEVFFWEVDVETRTFVTVVGNCEELLGYQPSELVGMRWTDFVATKDVAEVARLDYGAGRRQVTTTVIGRDGLTRVFRHSVERDSRSGLVHGVSADISELAEATELIRHQAERDHLTGLSNRMVLLRQLDRTLAGSTGGVGSILLLLDLNRFKEVNDTFGHPAGDRLLQALAARLVEELSDASVVARLGGDEFAVLANGVSERGAAADLARRIHRIFQRKIDIDGVSLVVTPSIGIVLLPEQAKTTEEAIRCADIAMYESKRSDRTFVIYHEDPGRLTFDRLLLGAEVGSALDDESFAVWFHGRFDLETGALVGVEGEPRWHHAEQGILKPTHFVELLELAGELVRYGRFVLTSAVRAAQRLEQVGLPVRMSVPLPAGCLLADDWLPYALDVLRGHDIHPSRFTLRLTDIAALGSHTDQVRVLRQIVDHGLGVAAEELAAPCSSPTMVRELPITEVKLGPKFVAELNDHSDNLLFARALIELSKLLDRTVVADGVADQATLSVLRSLGCHVAQGPLLAKPMAEDELIEFVQDRSERWTQPAP